MEFIRLFTLMFLLTQQAAGNTFAVVGDLRGHVEPCGCNPATDLGGVFRLGGFVEKMQLTRSEDISLLSTGNSFHKDTFSDADSVILESLAKLPFKAILVNTAEISHAAKIAKKSKSQIPFVLSNAETSISKRVITTKNLIIYGYLSPKDGEDRQGPTGSWLKRVPNTSEKPKVLLFSGPQDELEMIVKARKFNHIISSNTNSFKVSPDGSERNQPGVLIRLQSPGAAVRQTPLGGQGVLLYGKAQTAYEKLNPNLSGIFSDRAAPSLTPLESPNPSLEIKIKGLGTPIAWLDNSFEISSSLTRLQDRFANLNQQAFAEHVSKFKPFLKDSPYAGAESCKTCHNKAYKVWKNSSHAQAHRTLIEASKDKDLSCVSCHVLGLQEKGGFVSLEASPHLANVQCENCHGPRKEHIKNPTKKSWSIEKAKSVCTGCHHPPHSVAFDYKAYFSKIAHGKN